MLGNIVFLASLMLASMSYSQILPNSPFAYKTMMKAKKTNMCYIIKSKVENGEIQDTLIFNFKDFIYDFQTNAKQVVTIELTKILKNYSDCKGQGGLRLDFKIKDRKVRTERYCANPNKVLGSDDIYTCFFIEKKNSKTKSKKASKKTDKKAPSQSCFTVSFFKKNSSYLDKVRQITRKDVKLSAEKSACI